MPAARFPARAVPAVTAAAHAPYFQGLQAALAAAGVARPAMVIDRDRLGRNVERLRALMAPGMRLRLVEKSLPVPALLTLAMEALGTHALMVFDGQQLSQVAQRFPAADVLLGKPLPVAAARACYRGFGAGGFDPARQLQWLIDTPARLAQYAALADELGTTMRVAIEIDVGLHRGGVATPAALGALLDTLAAPGSRLAFSGLMGYDAHVGKLPALIERADTGFRHAAAAYQAFQAVARARFPARADALCWNGAGSPTLPRHRHGSPLNEVSAGSVLLKPLAFDTPPLADFEPAVFIVTPVLKALEGTRLPGPAWFSRLLYAGRRRRAMSYFVYGGGWPAKPASPTGLVENAQFGLSFNQAILNGPASPRLAVDELVFLRPWQSEGVLLQFGAVQVVAGGRVVDAWEPFAV